MALGFLFGPTAIVLAENAAPGEALYGLKLGVERVRLLVNGDPAREVHLHLEFATKRVLDLRPLLVEGGDPGLVRGVTENLRAHTVSSLVGLEEVGEPGQGEALRAQAETVLSRQVDSLSDFFEQACGGTAGGGPASPCDDLRRAFTDSARALEVVRPVAPLAHEQGGPDGRGQGSSVGKDRPGERGGGRGQQDKQKDKKMGGKAGRSGRGQGERGKSAGSGKDGGPPSENRAGGPSGSGDSGPDGGNASG